MGLAHEKKSYLQEKANLFEIGSVEKTFSGIITIPTCMILSSILEINFYVYFCFLCILTKGV